LASRIVIVQELSKPRQAEAAALVSRRKCAKAVIRRYARAVAERFKPEKIILFGSHAYGKPHADSDVDILVVMPARNEIDQAVRIDRVIDPQFPLDVIVCTPKNMAWRLQEGDSFLQEIMTKGKVLYEKANGPMGAHRRRLTPRSRVGLCSWLHATAPQCTARSGPPMQ
jgi:predicted nucleotidyltransferase